MKQRQPKRWSRPRRARWAKLVGVRLSATQADEVYAIADAREVPVSDVIREAVDRFLATDSHLKAAG